jgi:N-acetylglucosamine-6-phosphate deacetylase
LNQVIDGHGLRSALPGFHLEGPFISRVPGAVGAHNPNWVQAPSVDALDWLNDCAGGRIAMLTVAAELPGVHEMIRRAHDLGIVVSLGHELATTEEIRSAGADTMTHLGNGLPNLIDRHRNPIWAGLAIDELPVMAITDGHHLPVEVVKCFLRCKGVDRFIAVSDAANVAGLPPGHYRSFSNDAVLEPNGLYHNPKKGCLVGSSSLLPDCAEFLRREQLLSEEEIERVCWRNPSRLMKLPAEP